MKMLLKTIYKRLVTLALLLIASFANVTAQNGIGTQMPNASSALEIQSTTKGLLIPRLSTAQKNNIISPATGLMLYDTTLNCVAVNNGTPSTPDWGCTIVLTSKFFYMPSINIPTDASLIGITQTKDLYGQYVSEFSAPKISSPGAPLSIPYFANATDLNYYVTYYDPTLIEISQIDNRGVMVYKLLKTANLDSYINIVFVPK